MQKLETKQLFGYFSFSVIFTWKNMVEGKFARLIKNISLAKEFIKSYLIFAF